MITINEHYLKLNASYLFTEIARRVREYKAAHPEADIIRLGIGDVTRALPASCIAAFHRATDDMACDATFHGYDDWIGYPWLKEKIARVDFHARNAEVAPDEIFLSDGAKCDTANFQELFAADIKIGVPDPVYPVYVDSNVMAGRTGAFVDGRYEGLTYLESTERNNYVPDIPDRKLDCVYLCFPNNPTGATASRAQLTQWVDYARHNKALILFDAAYVAFIRDPEIPHSIYEIPGARDVAIEFRSYSKTAGFTGVRCAYTVVPKECLVYDRAGNRHSLHQLWQRRQSTKFNGVCYMVQRAAEAVYSDQGQAEIRELADYYLANARRIRETMTGLGYACCGGDHAPYIWIKTGMNSWEFFDLLLKKANVVCTPGEGFGRCGAGYIRISAFNSPDNVRHALDRIAAVLKSGR